MMTLPFFVAHRTRDAGTKSTAHWCCSGYFRAYHGEVRGNRGQENP